LGADLEHFSGVNTLSFPSESSLSLVVLGRAQSGILGYFLRGKTKKVIVKKRNAGSFLNAQKNAV